MDKIVVIGASGHAKVVLEAIELNKKYEILGFIDTYKAIGDKLLGYEVLGQESFLKELAIKGVKKGIISIGDNWIRSIIYQKIIKLVPDFEFITVVHPSAIISPYATIGKGTVVLASGTVNADAVVGDFCIINTNANFGHDSIMQDFSSLAPGVTTGGAVFVGEYTAISIGATVLQNISIGKHTVIGAGAVVTSNVNAYMMSYGVPAKVIRNRKKGEGYLSSVSLDTQFKIKKIKTKEELNIYEKNVKAVYDSNPFYKVELLDTTDMNIHRLCYFVLNRDDTPIIIMPFYKRRITVDGVNTEYSDVISPYGYSGPLYNPDTIDEDSIKHFWKQVNIWYRKKNIISEFIRFSLNGNHIQYNGVLSPSLKNIKGNIIEKDVQWEKFKPKVRNNHRKAVQEELKLVMYRNSISQDIIKDFYDIYIQTMHRNNAHSQYFHYIDYFKNFIINNPESCMIAMIYKEDTPISTELILIDGSTLYSYLGGTLSDYFYTRPNDFLKIEVLNWAREHNFTHYVLGGGREDGDGLYKYKKSFFPNDEDAIYYIGKKIINQVVYENLVAQKCEGFKSDSIDEKVSDFFPLYRKYE
ncbi:hypothetical protein GCM10022393_13660 [Aquimarina addita]|uniref:Acetyltransferase n=1 Tax=Aquimarina addita TaxID=870485 RepID=A0ABP7XF24_9FLAO